MAELKPIMMKLLSVTFLWWFCVLSATAQHDLYKWQIKGYTGIANYYNPVRKYNDYLTFNRNLWHRLEINRSIGSTFGVSASASFGNIRGQGVQGNVFTTEARMTSVRLYFYTDNGWLLKPTSFISPYFFGGFGLGNFTMNANGVENQVKAMQLFPFGLGLKVRLTERWQLDLQTEAVYSSKSHLNTLVGEQNKYNNGFIHTGLALAYNLGYKKKPTFNAARFYASFRDTILARTDTQQTATAKLATRPIALAAPEKSPGNPRIIVHRDTVVVSDRYTQPQTDTLRRKKVVVQDIDTVYVDDRARTINRKNLTYSDTVTRTRQVAPLRQRESASVRESLRTTTPYTTPRSSTRIYQPAPRVYDRIPVSPASPNSVALLETDRRQLEEANRKNRQLRYTRDSLYQVMAKDTVLRKQANQQNLSTNVLDDKMLRYMQEQAALNDNMKQRLAYYDNELSRLQQAEVSTPSTSRETMISAESNIFFALNSYEVPSPSINSLMAFAEQLKANPGLKLQLTGYADRTGNPNYNLVLSRKRVEAVSAYFQELGIDNERILMQYFGESKTESRLNPLGRKVVINIID